MCCWSLLGSVMCRGVCLNVEASLKTVIKTNNHVPYSPCDAALYAQHVISSSDSLLTSVCPCVSVCVCAAGLVVSDRSGSVLPGSDHGERERHDHPDRAAAGVRLLNPTRVRVWRSFQKKVQLWAALHDWPAFFLFQSQTIQRSLTLWRVYRCEDSFYKLISQNEMEDKKTVGVSASYCIILVFPSSL